jgi:hypothetical protein
MVMRGNVAKFFRAAPSQIGYHTHFKFSAGIAIHLAQYAPIDPAVGRQVKPIRVLTIDPPCDVSSDHPHRALSSF